MTESHRPAFARVLCPTDFSEFSTAALTYAAALAASYGSTLRLLHVLTPFPIVPPLVDVPGGAQLYESQRLQGQQALEAEAARVRRPGLSVDVELRDGSAVHEVLTAAREWQADLIVLGTHGRGGVERLVLGSVAEKVLRKATCAVLAVPHDAIARAAGAARITHVLCAHDGSEASAAGVGYAVSLAGTTGAKLTSRCRMAVTSPAPTSPPSAPPATRMRARRSTRPYRPTSACAATCTIGWCTGIRRNRFSRSRRRKPLTCWSWACRDAARSTC